MSLTMMVTRNLPERFGGFLASCMLQVAPGVYVAPRMGTAVRERVWDLMQQWMSLIPEDGGIVLLWRDHQAPSGLGMRMIGWPKTEIIEQEGTWLSIGSLTKQHDLDELQRLAESAKDQGQRA